MYAPRERGIAANTGHLCLPCCSCVAVLKILADDAMPGFTPYQYISLETWLYGCDLTTPGLHKEHTVILVEASEAQQG